MKRISYHARILTALIILGFLCSGAVTRASSGWSKRGIFVFGDIVFDFQSRVWKYGGILHHLEDCSTAEFFCARVYPMPIVVPRACGSAEIGKQWAAGGITTEILAEGNGVSPTRPRLRYVGNPDRSNFLYVYEAELGVSAIYFDVAGKVNFHMLARAGRLREVQKPAYFFPLTTFDKFGACAPETGGGAQTRKW